MVLKCPNCGKDVPDDMALCGYCGALLKDATKPSIIQLLAENAEPLANLAERVVRSVGEVLVKPEEKKFINRTLLAGAVLCLVGIAVVFSYLLARDGIIDGGTFAFSMGIVLGAMITLIGDLLLYE